MSIVEKAVDKLRESNTGQRRAEADEPAKPAASGGERATNGIEDTSGDLRSGELHVVFDRLRAQGVLPAESMAGQVRDEYRRIKRPLLANVTGRGAIAVEHGNRIMITSAIAGEGKTFTTFNLAVSLSQERDISVVLVDGDVARPTTSRVLGLQNRPGLVDLIVDETLQPGDVLVPTDIENLSVLPAGHQNTLSTELLSSERMDAVVRALAQSTSRRVLLFDSPPLLSAPESQALSGPMGQIVMVVKAGTTLQQQVQAAIDMLDPSKAINLVLNQSRRSHGDYYGSYYGYYGQEK